MKGDDKMLIKEHVEKLRKNEIEGIQLGWKTGKELKEILSQLKEEGVHVSNKYHLRDGGAYQSDIFYNGKFYKLFIH